MKKETLKKFDDIKKLIGNTPLVKIIYEFEGKKHFMFAKLEWFNLTGSIKDRPAYEILRKAYEMGALKEGQIICETTSGNMGISLCAIANRLSNPVVICMPKFLSEERKQLLRLLGAKLELTENFDEAFEKAQKYGKKGAFLSFQFENENNKLAHMNTTASEICDKLKEVPAFVSGVGTGGTLIGVGSLLKEKRNSKIIAIDPAESSLLLTGKSQGKHKIQGLSDGLIPKLYDKSVVDEILPVSSDDAIAMARKLSQALGLGVGISSGANFLGCVLSKIDGAVTVFADDNKKYLSTDLSKDIKSELVEKIKLIGYEVV